MDTYCQIIPTINTQNHRTNTTCTEHHSLLNFILFYLTPVCAHPSSCAVLACPRLILDECTSAGDSSQATLDVLASMVLPHLEHCHSITHYRIQRR